MHSFGGDGWLVSQIGLGFDRADHRPFIAELSPQTQIVPCRRGRLQVEEQVMTPENKLPQDFSGLQPPWDLPQPRVAPASYADVRRSGTEDANVKALGVKAAHNLARIAHLRVGQASVGEAVYQDANGMHAW